jgi:hypothetical protein
LKKNDDLSKHNPDDDDDDDDGVALYALACPDDPEDDGGEDDDDPISVAEAMSELEDDWSDEGWFYFGFDIWTGMGFFWAMIALDAVAWLFILVDYAMRL